MKKRKTARVNAENNKKIKKYKNKKQRSKYDYY